MTFTRAETQPPGSRQSSGRPATLAATVPVAPAVHVVARDRPPSRSKASEAGAELWEGLGILDGSTSTPWFPSGNGDHGAVLCDQESVSVPGVLLRVSRWSYILIFSNSPGGWEQHGCT